MLAVEELGPKKKCTGTPGVRLRIQRAAVSATLLHPLGQSLQEVGLEVPIPSYLEFKIIALQVCNGGSCSARNVTKA